MSNEDMTRPAIIVFVQADRIVVRNILDHILQEQFISFPHLSRVKYILIHFYLTTIWTHSHVGSC